MKVLHLLDSLNRGGAEMLALDVCRNARENDLDLIFAATGGGKLENDFRNSGTEFLRLNRRLPIDLQIVYALRKIVSERKIKIIHTHQAVEAVHAFLASLGTNAKVVLTHHAYVPDAKNLYALKFLAPRVTQNLVVSKFLLGWYRDEIGLNVNKNFKVLYNGVDKKRLKPSGKSVKAELGINPDSLLIGMVGNFYREPRKDQLTICRALPKVFEKIPDAYCLFAGKIEPGAEEKFEACVRFCKDSKIENRVFFLGERDDVPDILDALDLFVFSSIHEGLPIAVNEAMPAKVPMIVSDISPLSEATNNGEFAEIFPVGNYEILAEKILILLKDKARAKSLAENAFRFAEENFSIEAHIENLKKLYNSLLISR